MKVLAILAAMVTNLYATETYVCYNTGDYYFCRSISDKEKELSDDDYVRVYESDEPIRSTPSKPQSQQDDFNFEQYQ